MNWGIAEIEYEEDARDWIPLVERTGCSKLLLPLRNAISGVLLKNDGAIEEVWLPDIRKTIEAVRALRCDPIEQADLDRLFGGVDTFMPKSGIAPVDHLGGFVGGADLLLIQDERFGDQFYRAGLLALNHALAVRVAL